MTTAIPVNYRDKSLVNALRVLGAIALIAGIALGCLGAKEAFPFALVLAVAGAGVVIGNEIVAAMNRRADCSVVDTGGGFRWIEGPAEVNVEDQQVVALRLKHTSKYASGILKAVVREFDVWIEGREQPFRMSNRLAAGSADPLAAMISRIIENLKQRTAAGLAAGAVLDGEGWRLAATQLTVQQGKQWRELPFVEMDHVAMFDGKLCIWIQGENEPVAKIAPDSKNAPVLGALLAEWVEHRKEAPGEAVEASTSETGLGRLLFERRQKEGLVAGLILGVLGIVIGTGLSFQRETHVAGLLAAGAGCVALVLGLLFGRYVFRCYERGLTRRRGRNETRMLYAEIIEFNYGATRMFHNGVYTGTNFALSFRAPAATIRYSVSIKNPDADIENLRDHIAKVIAGRMFEEVRQCKPVSWGNDAVFLPTGLQFRRPKVLGFSAAAPEVLPYDQIRGTNMQQGVLYLFSKTEAKAVFSKPVASANFFPGFYLLLTLLDISRQPAQAT